MPEFALLVAVVALVGVVFALRALARQTVRDNLRLAALEGDMAAVLAELPDDALERVQAARAGGTGEE